MRGRAGIDGELVCGDRVKPCKQDALTISRIHNARVIACGECRWGNVPKAGSFSTKAHSIGWTIHGPGGRTLHLQGTPADGIRIVALRYWLRDVTIKGHPQLRWRLIGVNYSVAEDCVF